MAAAMALGGCTTMVEAPKRIEQAQQKAESLRDQAVASATKASVSQTARPRLAGEEIVLRAQGSLPEIFAKQVTFTTQGAQSLPEALDAIATVAGVSIRGVEQVNEGPQQGASSSGQGQISGKVSMEFNGTLRSLLDDLAARANASWRYNHATKTVEVFRFETKTLSLYLPPGNKKVDASISLSGVGGNTGGGGGGGSSGAGQVAVTQNLTIDPWTSVMNGIQSILNESSSQTNQQSGNRTGGAGQSTTTASGSAGRAAANPELGLITVTARPHAIQRVEAYVTSVNARFARNVMVDVKIYNLTMSQDASAGFSMDLLYRKMGGLGMAVVGAAPIQPAGLIPGQLTISQNGTSRFSGSELLVQALSQFGNVSLQTQGQVLAINGQPSPIQVANEVSYLAQQATTVTANVGTTTTMTPGTRVVGFTGNFIPTILGDNRILLQYQLQISALTALNQVGSGANIIQTPQISSQSLQQQAFLRDGESIVLFGFDQSRDTTDRALSLGGASGTARINREMLVIVMQVAGGHRNV
ncbi:Type II secretory pathway component PulD-like protein [Caenimonas sedimenti]|uniref:Type II secretory pathway component PulD-like protein n=1 Tax=Caenimonas sedimenti TaxID=2596921 RepID=UPI00164663C5|nr:Type II secretory pathway component PulD-like protein [Caenimonas sedimenti]